MMTGYHDPSPNEEFLDLCFKIWIYIFLVSSVKRKTTKYSDNSNPNGSCGLDENTHKERNTTTLDDTPKWDRFGQIGTQISEIVSNALK